VITDLADIQVGSQQVPRGSRRRVHFSHWPSLFLSNNFEHTRKGVQCSNIGSKMEHLGLWTPRERRNRADLL